MNVFSLTDRAAYSAYQYSSSAGPSLSAYSSKSAYSYSSSAAVYSSSSNSVASASSASAFSASVTAYSQSSASAASASSRASWSQASANAYSSASLSQYSQAQATSLSQYSSNAAAYSQSSAAAYSQASSLAGYSAGVAASASSRAQWSSQSALQASQSAYSAASQYSAQSALQASQSAYSSASQYSASSAALAQSIAGYSASQAAAYSQSTSLAGYSSASAASAASRASWSAQAYSQSIQAYSQSVSAAQASQSAAQLSQSIAQYSQSVAGYSQSVQAAQASQAAAQLSQSIAQYSQSVAGYSQSVQAAQASQSAQAYSASQALQASAAQFSATSLAAYSASQSLAAYSANANAQLASASASLSAYSAAQSLAAYSANANAQLASASASLSAYSASLNNQASTSSLSAVSPQATSLPSGWAVASTACIAEGNGGRALSSDSTSSGSMTPSMCISYCSGKGYQLAGVEYSGECWCSNVLSNGASLNKLSTSCNMPCSGAPSTICGGPDAINLFVLTSAIPSLSPDFTSTITSSTSSAAASAPTVALPSGWSVASVGIAEGITGRALQGASTSSSAMTLPMCLNYCQGKGFQYAGLEYSSECWCGSTLSGGASLSLTSPNCNMPCSGAPGSICGGPACLSLYVNPSLAPAAPAAVPLPSGWSVASTSCIAEGTTGRALQGASTASGSMTPQMCLNFCSSKGYPYAGIEYSGECYCDSALVGGASLSLTSPNCNMKCSGDQNQICGGPSCLSLFYNSALVATPSSAAPTPSATPISLPSGWSTASTSCIQEVQGRALTGAFADQPNMTLETCLNMCASKGFTMAGLEYASQCFCGSSLVNGASLSVASKSCNMPCAGNSGEICGGPDAIQLFVNPNVAPLVTSTSSATPAVSTTPSITVNGYTSAGCIQEVVNRALPSARKDDPNMTLDMCTSYCFGLGYQMAGIEYGQECYCSTNLANGASTSLVSGQCYMKCPGNANQICGGPNAIVLFVNPNAVAPSPSSTSSAAPAPTTPLPSGWSVASTPCLAEATQGGRALSAASTSSPQMTINMCLNYCQGQGYQYAGIEYSQECFCGNGFTYGASLSQPASQCNMKCGGDSNSICGGPDSISLYVNPSLAQTTTSSASPASSPSPSPAPAINGFASNGCIQEVVGRALNSDRHDDPNMTIEICTSYCAGKGYSLAGVEYGTECYCSSQLSGGASTSLVSGQCYMTCPGNSSEMCGGPNAIQLYQLSQ